MRVGPSIGICIGILAIIMSSGCSDRDAESITVDDHVFNVPREYLIEERIPWLPQAEQKGLLFHLNPEALVREQISVLVESRSITCRDEEASTQLARHCADKEALIEDGSLDWENVKKVEPNDDPTQWSYVYESKGAAPITIASCFAMADGENGLCTVLGSYTDLVYTLRVKDSEITRIPEIKKAVTALLSSWDDQERTG